MSFFFRNLMTINMAGSNLAQEMTSRTMLVALTADHSNSEITSFLKVACRNNR